MRKRILLAAVTLLISATAFAQPQRTFVSVLLGSDSNPCLRTSPCRNFATAIAAVAPGGEVVALDSGGFGPFVVNKSVSVIAPSGIYAGITVLTGADGITVDSPGIIVVLRGLVLNALGVQDAIEFANGSSLSVEGVVTNGFSGSGLYTHADGARFTIHDVAFRQSQFGIFVADAATFTEGAIDHARLDVNAQGGLVVGANGTVTVRDSVFFNDDPAVKMTSGSSQVTLDNCFVSALFTGIQGDANTGLATVNVSGTTFVDTVNAMIKTGSGANNTFVSFGNNRFFGNGTDGVFDGTILLK